MPVCLNDDWLTCLKEKELIIVMVLVTYSILATLLKWRPANGVVYKLTRKRNATSWKVCISKILENNLCIAIQNYTYGKSEHERKEFHNQNRKF